MPYIYTSCGHFYDIFMVMQTVYIYICMSCSKIIVYHPHIKLQIEKYRLHNLVIILSILLYYKIKVKYVYFSKIAKY